MKKFRYFVLFACLLASFGCKTVTSNDFRQDVKKDKYQVILLGDLHYDNIEYHTKEKQEQRKKEITRNTMHWQETAPKIIAAAADQATPDTLFAVQLGDITQGDAKSQEAQSALFTEALAAASTPFIAKQVPFFLVKGNHDFRSPGEGAAFNETVVPFIKKQLPSNSFISGSNYSISHGNDLFIFVDCEHPDLDFITRTINDFPNLRHLFVIDHLTVLPYGPAASQWTLFGARQGELQARRSEFIKLIASHNAIMLAGHVHDNSLTCYNRPDFGTITQITLSSMQVSREDYPELMEGYDKNKIEEARKKVPDFIDEFIPYINTYKRTFEGGYAIVSVDNTNVTINYFHGNNKQSTLSWKLK